VYQTLKEENWIVEPNGATKVAVKQMHGANDSEHLIK